ncbi:MAG: CRTAC1 family protein, partial [Isosphaeraceae bacterium]
ADSNDLCGFVWADFDQDGTPDAGLLNAQGEIKVYTNERSGRFLARSVPKDLGAITALTIADMNSDGSIDILALRSDGAVLLISDRDDGGPWNVEEIARCSGKPGVGARLFSADLDNNGGLDLLVSDGPKSQGWLTDESSKLRPLAAPINLRVMVIADLNNDGRLDLAGLSNDGRGVRAVARGTKNYHWQVVRPKGAKVVGDGRINSFGLGGEVEVRAGLLVQKQVITGSIVHFGLGEHAKTDVSRVVWPNGTMQAEFNTKANAVIAAEQRLKGSCPFVYAFDGQRMNFVTDFLWRSPLGLRINAQDTAGVAQTEDWIKIRGDQLKPHDGMYEICLTAELWETHYFDHVSLMVVDHPIGTEVFVDERFARQPPPLAVQTTGPLIPLAVALDDEGRDVTDLVRARDGVYLDNFGRGFYQGVTRDHWVELELSDDALTDRPLVLVAQGWIHPTDSSINVALGQGGHEPPRGLSLEVPTRNGEWVVAKTDLGFPAGKNKTILINLDGVFKPDAPRRLRLRTNLEIYWDAFAVATVENETPLKTRRILPESADLQHRGYSLMMQANASSPELPIYETLTGTRQRWLDLVGLYTRYGDVRELLEKVDDRYAIVNAGDEVAFRFPAPEAPPKGWLRDYVLIGDGWNKDGDFNTAYSRTVLPLPSHDRPGYDALPGPLEEDPVYQKNPQDWEHYHIRPINPRTFLNGLRPVSVAQPD